MANIPLKSIKFPGLSDIYTIESDLSEEAKEALLACFRHVAWADGQGQNCYNALENALQQNKPDPTGMVSLNVSYSQPYILDAGTNIDLLKQNLIVIGEYSDGREARISSAYYTLTGIIDGSGRNTITVSYANLSSQFTVLSAPSNRWVNDVLTITNDALTSGSINATAPDYSDGRTVRLAYRGFWLDFDPNYKYTITVNSSKSINVAVRTYLVGQMNRVRVEENIGTAIADSKWQDSGFVTNASGITIPSIPAGESIVLKITWLAPDPAVYANIMPVEDADWWHFCLAARVHDGTPIVGENSHLLNMGTFTRNNDNVAWKNITIIESPLKNTLL